LRGVIEAAVAFSGQPWRLWRYGQIKRHGRKSYSIRIRAFVAFVAFVFDLGLAIKKKEDDTLRPPADIITARKRPQNNATNASNASKPYRTRVSAVALCRSKTPRLQLKTPRLRHITPRSAV